MTTATLINYINGHSSEAQNTQVKEWLSQDKANREKFETVKQLYEAGKNQEILNLEKELAWANISKSIGIDDRANRSRSIPFYQQYWRGIAAAITIIILGAAVFFVNKDYITDKAPIYYEIVATGNQVKEVNLPDGSTVWLKPEAVLKYPKIFEERLAVLVGEAYFEVESAQSTFTIETAQSNITVLGTAFSVFTNEEETRLSVHEGKVKIATLDGVSSNILKHNNTAIIQQGSPRINRFKSDLSNDLAWKTGILSFEDISLSEALLEINKHFNANIRLQDTNQGRCKLTARFDNQSIDDVVRTIGQIMGLEVKGQSKSDFLLVGESC